jgi:hypothetical protein
VRDVNNSSRPSQEKEKKKMTGLKRLGASALLALALTLTAFAGDPQPPNCLDPGQTGTMPCSAAKIAPDEPKTTTDLSGSPVFDAMETAITETAIDIVQSLLLLS